MIKVIKEEQKLTLLKLKTTKYTLTSSTTGWISNKLSVQEKVKESQSQSGSEEENEMAKFP